jgi:hypothetical protein
MVRQLSVSVAIILAAIPLHAVKLSRKQGALGWPQWHPATKAARPARFGNAEGRS